MDKHRTERPLPWVFTEFFMKGKLNKRKEEEDGLNTHTHTLCEQMTFTSDEWQHVGRDTECDHSLNILLITGCVCGVFMNEVQQWERVGSSHCSSFFSFVIITAFFTSARSHNLGFFLMTNLVSLLFSPLLMSPWFLAFPHTSA